MHHVDAQIILTDHPLRTIAALRNAGSTRVRFVAAITTNHGDVT
jgi:hypothetical protein